MGSSPAELLDTRLREAHLARIRLVETLAGELSTTVYLVGGTARDLLLDLPLGDLDLVVEGAVPPLAEALSERLGCDWRHHAAFGTAEILDPEIRIDLAATRTETYLEPAALPVVAPAGLEADLERRDFTVNALAIRLGGARRGEVTDCHGGLDDLAQRRLRVLHSRSFLDDPTRILRGIRFESRLGFHFESLTETLAREAVDSGIFDALSAARWRNDLRPLLGGAAVPLDRLESLGVLRWLHPDLSVGRETELRLTGTESAMAAIPEIQLMSKAVLWKIRLLVLAWQLSSEGRAAVGARLELQRGDRELLLLGPRRVEGAVAALADRALAPHRVEEIVRPLAGEELVFVAASGGVAAEWVRRGLVELLPLELTIGGADLIEKGVRTGPDLGRALAATRRARLDGRIGSAEELEYAQSRLEIAENEKEA